MCIVWRLIYDLYPYEMKYNTLSKPFYEPTQFFYSWFSYKFFSLIQSKNSPLFAVAWILWNSSKACYEVLYFLGTKDCDSFIQQECFKNVSRCGSIRSQLLCEVLNMGMSFCCLQTCPSIQQLFRNWSFVWNFYLLGCWST